MTFDFDLIKGKSIAWPRIENDEYIMVAGSVRPLMDAFRIAHTEMVLWLEGEYGLDRWEALPAPLPTRQGAHRECGGPELHRRRHVPQKTPASAVAAAGRGGKRPR